MTEMIERVARALAEFRESFGYSIRLTRLVDGEATYRLTLSDCDEAFEFGSHGDAAEHVANRKQQGGARAAIEAMREPTDEMRTAGFFAVPFDRVYGGEPYKQSDSAEVTYRAMIDAALSAPR